MLTPEESRENRQRFEQELALAVHAIRTSYEMAYEQFVYLGSSSAKSAALEQWRAADAKRIDQAIARETERLRLIYPHETVADPRTAERRGSRGAGYRFGHWVRQVAGLL